MTDRRKKVAHVSREDRYSLDIPEATDAEFAIAWPFKELFPEQYDAWNRRRKQPLSRSAGEGAEARSAEAREGWGSK